MGLTIYLGKTSERIHFSLQSKLIKYLRDEALRENKTMGEIIRNSLIDRYITEIARKVRKEALERYKANKERRKAELKSLSERQQSR